MAVLSLHGILFLKIYTMKLQRTPAVLRTVLAVSKGRGIQNEATNCLGVGSLSPKKLGLALEIVNHEQSDLSEHGIHPRPMTGVSLDTAQYVDYGSRRYEKRSTAW